MKNLLTLLLFLTISITCFSQQKRKNIYYLDSLGQKIKTTDSVLVLKPSDYIRIIEEADSGAHFSLIEYYYNQKIKRTGSVSIIDPPRLEGYVVDYYISGKRKSVYEYEKGQQVRQFYEYYPNGQLKMEGEYLSRDDKKQFKTDFKVTSFYDSTGVQRVKNGTGTMSNTQGNLTTYGKYTDGLKDSTWTGLNPTNNYSFTEQYDHGKFISGILKKDGVETGYTEAEIQPEFPGGMKKFLEFVGRNYIYPASASRMGVSGRVIIQFVIEKDGKLSDMKILRDIGYGTGEEALRVLNRSPKWNPGIQHGIPVRVNYILPIALSAPR